MKVMIVGDSGVGKTSLIDNFINGTGSSVEPTIAIDMFFKKMKIKDMFYVKVYFINKVQFLGLFRQEWFY